MREEEIESILYKRQLELTFINAWNKERVESNWSRPTGAILCCISV